MQLDAQLEEILHASNPHVHHSAAVVQHFWKLDRPFPDFWFVHVGRVSQTEVAGAGRQLFGRWQKGFGYGGAAFSIPHGAVDGDVLCLNV